MTDTFVALGVALGLGLLVGFQRERTEESLAGFRTFPLIAVAGALSVDVGRWTASTWVVPAGVLALVALVVTGNLARWRRGEAATGITTEIAALVMFLVGAAAAAGYTAVAVVTGGGVAVLLYFKRPMHALATRLEEDDVRAVMRVVVVGLVILPVLPDRTFGPYDVLNPFRIWLMVVLIAGISVASYVLYRLLGARAGTLLGGVLGGLVSSTATTASYARRSRRSRGVPQSAAVVLMVASTVVFGRIAVEVGAVAPGVLGRIAAPLAAMAAWNVALCGVGFWLWGDADAPPPERGDPTELRVALVFGVLYGAIVFAVAAAVEHLGDVGLYGVAAVSGLTDVDAVTLSIANLADAGRVSGASAWRAILLATLSNLTLKGVIAATLGGRPLLVRVAPLFAVSLAGGVAILALWPAQ